MTNGWTAKQIQPPYIIHYGIGSGSPDAVVRKLKEAGVNIVCSNNWFDSSVETKTNISQICQKYHMGLMPWGMFNPAYRASLIPQWSGDPAIFGWFLWDEPGRGERPLSLYKELYQQFRQWSGNLPMTGIWDDPVWGNNIAPGVIDILGYEAQYPFEKKVSDPYARTTALTALRGYGGGPLQKAQEAGVIVIPVLQAFQWGGSNQPLPDPPGQYDAYEAGFTGGDFAGGAYLYDPSGHVIGIPEIKALVQDLVIKLGGEIWLPEQEITCPQCESLLKIQT